MRSSAPTNNISTSFHLSLIAFAIDMAGKICPPVPPPLTMIFIPDMFQIPLLLPVFQSVPSVRIRWMCRAVGPVLPHPALSHSDRRYPFPVFFYRYQNGRHSG